MTLESELAALRQPLMRFAQLQLRNPSLAEDVVSETLWRSWEPDNFEGRSSLRTYATGILKFKIIDVCASAARGAHRAAGRAEHGRCPRCIVRCRRHWQEPPATWQQPEHALEQQQFFDILQACVDQLPPKLGRVFMMREWLEREIDDICRELGITSNNCGVMLYRARMQLRECLDRQWFKGQR